MIERQPPSAPLVPSRPTMRTLLTEVAMKSATGTWKQAME